MGEEEEDPILIKFREAQARAREQQQLQQKLQLRERSMMPTAGAAKWQTQRQVVINHRAQRLRFDLNNLYRPILQCDATSIAEEEP